MERGRRRTRQDQISIRGPKALDETAEHERPARTKKDRFFSHFLRDLFFEGFAKPESKRAPIGALPLGDIPYLNGGLFLPHGIETRLDLYTYLPLLKELSEDDAIPKFSTHLIYLTKADHRSHIEEKVIKSIFSKKPKRADVYWFLHLNRTDSPYTLNYEVAELLDDKVIRIDINLGFRVQPRTELFFKKIVQDLVKNKELNLHIRPDGSTKYNPEPDFKFVVIEKFLSLENEFSLRDGLLLNSYFFLKKLSQSDEKAFGLDKSDIVVEDVPMLVQPVQKLEFKRVEG